MKTCAHQRVVVDELRQRLGHQQLGRVGAAAETQLAAFQAVVLQQLVVQALAAGQQAPGVLQHQLALAGEAKLAAAALDQGTIQIAFQGLDAAAERGLAEVDGIGGAHEATVIGQGHEVAKLSKVHHAPLACSRYFLCI
ncbi:hypothetical protein D3C76_1316690 [compost metagenome]